MDILIISDKSRIDDVMQDIDDGCIMVKFLIGFLLPVRALHNIDIDYIDDWWDVYIHVRNIYYITQSSVMI